MKVGLVIMASGLAKRFGSNKLMAYLNDKPLIKWIIDTSDHMFDQKIVVTRSCSVSDLCDKIKIQCIHHELPLRSDTVRLGICALNDDIDYCFFVPGDQPLIKKETLLRLIEEAKKNPGMIIRAGYKDTIGLPMGFPRSLFDELMNLPEGKGGSAVSKRHEELVKVIQVIDETELIDIDTREDFELLKNRLEQMEGQSL